MKKRECVEYDRGTTSLYGCPECGFGGACLRCIMDHKCPDPEPEQESPPPQPIVT